MIEICPIPHSDLAILLGDIHRKKASVSLLQLILRLLDNTFLPIVETTLWDSLVIAEVPNTQSALREAGIQFFKFVFCPRHNIKVFGAAKVR